MLRSPAKRRRLDSSTTETDSGTDPNPSLHQQPTTPTRASYLSPTRSSLARSHPHLINRTTSRSSSKPTAKRLRDEILRPPGKPSETLSAAASPPSLAAANDSDQSEGGSRGNQTATNSAHTTTTDAPDQTQPSSRSWSASSEQQPVNQPRRSPTGEADPLPYIFKPILVSRPSSGSRPGPRNRSEELDLPPTPVQLGLSTMPDKPRGLASSSSPRGSKSGSGRRRRRRTDGPITSSPLKPKDPGRNARESDDRNAEDLLVIEALESELDDSRNIAASSLVKKKGTNLSTLRERLEQLKMEVRRLDVAVEKDEADDDVLSLLLPSTAECANVGAADEEKAMQYLSLFSPGDLRLTTSTKTKKVRGRTKIIHTLGLKAPPPWPVHAFTFAFEVVVDAEDARVEDVSRIYTAAHPHRKGPTVGIQKWVWQRMDHPLHKLDVGGVIWGLGQWFAASTERAKVFHRLDLQYNLSSSDDTKIGKHLTERGAIMLLPFLHRTQVQINVPGETKRPKKKILLLWDINIDWSSEVKSNIRIAASGVPAKTGRDLAEVFASLFPTKGVAAAAEYVLGLLQGDEETESPVGEPVRRRKRK
ncbi:uncharacterized protein A1O9_12277, partial [Exophiala aquamarina CBS 119918]